jgi:hypothetical protein
MTKRIILGLFFGLMIGIFGALALFNSPPVQNVLAGGQHTQWSSWTDTSSCVANSCDTSEGTKTQERTCIPGGSGYECSLAHQECDKDCPEVTWSAERLTCPSGYYYWGYFSGKHWCEKNGSQTDWKEATKETFGPITFKYEKSQDPNKCHRPTGASLNVPSWAMNDFNSDNPEWKDAINVNCQEVPADKETRTIACSDAPFIACEGACPTECGYLGGTVPDGKGGDKACEATEPCVTCEQESWSCQECQTHIGCDICVDEFEGYCGEEYGCKWTEICEPNGDLKLLVLDGCRREWVCENTCQPEPTPSPEPEQPRTEEHKSEPGPASAPVCTDGNTINLPANPHVLRSGSQATVNWFQTEADEANIYYKEVGQDNWTHAVSDIKVTSPDKYVSYTIYDLDPNLGYVFGIQQKHGCGGGETVTAVIVDGPTTQLFPFSYWEWTK